MTNILWMPGYRALPGIGLNHPVTVIKKV